jgi:ribosomal protein S12 methylthiotransferase accessory factor
MLLRGPDWVKLASSLQRGLPTTGAAERSSSDAADFRFFAKATRAFLAAPDTALPLLRFAGMRDIDVEIFEVPGAFLAMANIAPVEGSRESITVSGKGFDAVRAVLACLGEAAEISSWTCRPGDVETCVETACLGNAARIDPNDVLGFSLQQIASRDRLNGAWRGWDAIPPMDQLRSPRLWKAVRGFHGDGEASCPAYLCYGRFGDVAYRDPSLNVDSNGCAAGTTPADARTRALLELVERDATGIWWHRGDIRTRLDLAGLEDTVLSSHMERYRGETGRKVWALDISALRTAHVVAAISCEDSGEDMALGFGAGFRMADAARSAFLEAIQSEAAMQAHAERAERQWGGVVGDADCRMRRWKRFADVRNFRFAIGEPGDAAETRAVGDVDGLLDEVESVCGRPVWFADLSRPGIDVPVAKAVCQGLSHFKVRSGCRRNTDACVPGVSTRTVGGRSQARKLLI